MAKKVTQFTRFQGIADFDKESLIPDQYAWSRSVDYRTNPRQLTLLPKTIKESGAVVIDLPKWAETVPSSLTTYSYGNAGNFYSRTSSGSWALLNTAPDSHGNGLAYYQEDDYVYYTSDNVIGRYGPLSSNPQFTNDFLGAQGGVPTNTNSLTLVAASSQYADRADTASLSVVGDLTLEAYFNATTLPAFGSTMALISKWDESGSTQSYMMDILGISGYFGSGADGSLTISSNTTDAPIDSACTGSAGSVALSATNASFVANQIVFIHQSQGTGAGTWMRNQIQSYTAGTITLTTPLNATYGTGAQVLVMKQYSAVTVDNGFTWSPKAWNGTTGGILLFLCSGTFTNNGTVSGNGKGFRGGAGGTAANGTQGEGISGTGTISTSANANGGGGGALGSTPTSGPGGGGGNGSVGAEQPTNEGYGRGGATAGTTDLTTITFGGGGGGSYGSGGTGGTGGNGGAILFFTAITVTNSGSITSGGLVGGDASAGPNYGGAGGGGAGGDILIKAQTATLGSATITASGAQGGGTASGVFVGGSTGGVGRIHLDYLTSFTGTTSPTLNSTQDDTLVTSTIYQARLGISSTGANSQFLTKTMNITTGMWYRLSISWKASTSTASFYLSATSQGDTVGTFTAIHNNASRFGIGMNRNGAGTVTNFLNGKIDDVRVWNTTRSASDVFNYTDVTLSGTEAGLVAYYQLNGNYSDSTANANTLTASGTPVFTTDVPFAGPSTRLDIDLAPSPEPSGQVYNVPVAISEAPGDRLTFTPEHDPQKSLDVLVAVVGTGDVTVTIHDQQNRVIATKTILTANIGSGYVEFIFSSPWRPVLGRTYHFHVTSTVNDTDLTTGTVDDLETAAYHTYFGFLVNDSDFHPIKKMLNFLAFGNERYVGTWDGAEYQPNVLTLGSGWRVRSLALWNEYLAIGCWKGTNIYDYDDGRIYFWDGISVTFNFFLDVPEGAINAMLGTKGQLHIWAGYQGNHLVYSGGQAADKVKQLPKITKDKYVEMFPGAVTMWKTLIHYGVAGNTDSNAIEQGVYSWGSTNKMYPETLSYDYPISTGGRTGSTIKIGMVYPVGRKLLIGWQDNVSYGVDIVDATGAPFSSGTVEFLIQDDDFIWRDQKAMILRGDFLPLNTGETIDIKYKLDRQSDWVGLTEVASATNTADEPGIARLPIENGQNREYQMAVDLFTSVSTSPTLLGESLYEDSLEEEQAF